MEILAVGTVAYDTIKTPFARGNNVLGGSLTYFSLAASRFAKVRPVAVVGQDFKMEHLKLFKKNNIDVRGLQAAPGKTFRWSGEYGYDLNERKTLAVHLNVLEGFTPVLSPAYKKIPYLFLGNIDPRLQLDVFRQVAKPRLVVTDTMDYWIERKKRQLLEVLKFTDVLIINDSETRQLAKEHNLVKAAKYIVSLMGSGKKKTPATLIIKQGEYGLLMFTRKVWFSLPAFVLEDVFDPTGAGDAFAGGFVGYLVKQKKLDEKSFRLAAVYGTVMASFCVEKLGPEKLISLDSRQIAERHKEFKKLSSFV
jgi:sugar/nucleoside kinase (ribokinase family)